MLFRLENRSSGRRTHCGVLEFIAEEGMMYMPYWVSYQLLSAWYGRRVKLSSATRVSLLELCRSLTSCIWKG